MTFKDLPIPLTREGCEMAWQMHQKNCPCGEPLVQFMGACCKKGVIASYEHGTGLLHLCCFVCERPIASICVADEATPEQRARFIA